MNSDAAILLEDTLPLLQASGFDQRKLAMIKSCEPIGLADDSITLATKAGFVKKTIEQNAAEIEAALTEAAFGPMRIVVELRRDAATPPAPTPSAQAEATPERPDPVRLPPSVTPAFAPEERPEADVIREADIRRRNNPLVETSPDSDLTFATFVEGEENRIALVAAQQVADGATAGFNPLFIYGHSGLGKTHLLKAVQTYIVANDPTRVCVYKTATEFLADYQDAMRSVRADKHSNAADELERNYRDVDVLIIDDIQLLKNAQRTIDFFFGIFNYLHEHGKQVIVAADRTPNELGAQLGFDERVTSRVGGGFQVGIDVPAFELKARLIESFLTREAGVVGGRPAIGPELVNYMAERAGDNIRSIKAFCVAILFEAEKCERAGHQLGREEVSEVATRHFGARQRAVSVADVQAAVEAEWNVEHRDLVGARRNKEYMEARHVAIWLSRALTNNTLADIGSSFGGRSHGTVKHSIAWVEEQQAADQVFNDRVARVRNELLEG